MIAAKADAAQSLDTPIAVGSRTPEIDVEAVCDCGVTTISALTETPLQRIRDASRRIGFRSAVMGAQFVAKA